jgi:hypothetical protein
MLAWAVVYYLGQAAKDVCRLPRPAFAKKLNAAGLTAAMRALPSAAKLVDNADGTWDGSAAGGSRAGVICLEAHYAAEFGMPSTHAANSVVLPWAVVMWSLSSGRCATPPAVLYAAASFYTASSTISRLYFGVHSVADIVAGLAMGAGVLAVDLLLGGAADAWLLSAGTDAAILVPCVAGALIALYPHSGPWKSTPGDTALVVGATAGVLASAALDAPRQLALSVPASTFGHWRAAASAASPAQLGAAAGRLLARLLLGWAACLLCRFILKPLAMGVFGALVEVSWGKAEAPEEDVAAGSRVGDTPAHLLGVRGGRLAAQHAGDASPAGISPLDSPNGGGDSALRRRGGASAGAAATSGAGAAAAEPIIDVAALRIKAPPPSAPSPRLVALPREQRYSVELPTKLLVYSSLGVTAILIVPRLYAAIGLS